MFNLKSKSRAEAQASPSFSDEHDDAFSEDSYLDPKSEKKFVRKLDFILVTWAFFAYLMKVSSPMGGFFPTPSHESEC